MEQVAATHTREQLAQAITDLRACAERVERKGFTDGAYVINEYPWETDRADVQLGAACMLGTITLAVIGEVGAKPDEMGWDIELGRWTDGGLMHRWTHDGSDRERLVHDIVEAYLGLDPTDTRSWQSALEAWAETARTQEQKDDFEIVPQRTAEEVIDAFRGAAHELAEQLAVTV